MIFKFTMAGNGIWASAVIVVNTSTANLGDRALHNPLDNSLLSFLLHVICNDSIFVIC